MQITGTEPSEVTEVGFIIEISTCTMHDCISLTIAWLGVVETYEVILYVSVTNYKCT